MGFFAQAALGFAKSATPVLQEQAKANADADARIKEKVQTAPVEEALMSRKLNLEAEIKRKEQQTQMQQAMDMMHQLNGSPSPSIDTSSDLGNPISPPAPTITSPTVNEGNPSLFKMTDGTTPASEPDHLANFQQADHQAQQLEVVAKFNPLLAGAAMAKRSEATEALRLHTEHKQDKNQMDTATHQTSSDIMKGVDENLKNILLPSQYQTDVDGKAVTLIKPELQTKEKEIAASIHAPLATAQMKEQGLSKDNASLIFETVQPTKDIIALKDPNTTWDNKVTAYNSLKSYLVKTYGNNAWGKITNDTNLKPIFSDHTLLENMARVEQNLPPQAKGEASSSVPHHIIGVKNEDGTDDYLNQLSPDKVSSNDTKPVTLKRYDPQSGKLVPVE